MTTIDDQAAMLARLQKLQAVTDAALEHVSLDELLDELLLRIRDALAVDTCAILLLDEDRAELVARAAKGIEEEVERGVRIPVGKGFAGRVVAERRPVVLPDVDHADVLNPILREKGIKSLLGAPLLARGRVLGVVHVGTLTPRDFGPEDSELLELVANRAALGLERVLAHEELLRLDALKREFIITASHELRTPASVIYGVAVTLAERKETLDGATVDGLLDVFHEASVRLKRLIDELLDFSRVEVHPVSTEPLHLRGLVEEVAAGLAPSTRAGIEIDVPDALEVVTDRRGVERVVANLLENAVVHGAPPIWVSAARNPKTTTLWVEDRGPGIADHFRGRLFDPFSRAVEAEGRPGVGLGLAIAHSYARRLGAQLAYEQAEPTGARFSLDLPQQPRDG